MRLLTIDQAAEQLGVSTKTVYRYVIAGRIPSVRLPSRDNGEQGIIRVRQDELDRFIEACAAGTTVGTKGGPKRSSVVPLGRKRRAASPSKRDWVEKYRRGR